MKKGLFLFILFLCSFSCDPSGEAQYTLGLLLPTQREERWVKDKEAMILEAQERGIELIIHVSDNSASLQMNQARDLFDQGVDLIILAPHDAMAASTIVGLAQDKKIPLLSYDRLVLNSPVEYYLSFDNEEVGRIQGRYLWETVGSGNYVLLKGSPSDNNSLMFYAGAMEILGPKIEQGEIQVLKEESITDWKPSEAFRLAQEALQAFRSTRIDAFLAPNDGTAGGVIRAIEQDQGIVNIPVTGQDAEISAARRIMAGKQAMTIFKDTRLLAKEAISIALSRLETGEWPRAMASISNGMTEVPSYFLKPLLVTQDNLLEVLVESGYIQSEDLESRP
jgi:D-xylose transport system substrate-binding protein